MSSEEIDILRKIELIEPSTGKLFFEHKTELIFCKPHLIPLKSQVLERLEEMQCEAARRLQEKRQKTTSGTRKSGKN
ncbi:PREDICTED: BBSome-interacting protein 1 [Rhagoletis zephyria]|uniref:BBSome-interacting protein 1 n=1 Tax=Rhagoletis zephyria TaxID=28612 RepID=UPI0008115ED8|nr:PREDICTED: BBSome-interacting protein 1 [Rhagoletis zephyria]XP_017465687.1 PREDICTED: BBSome-interacting protein 1 [Rhagoletis zephyria]XP_017465688.1 PREDICTED: BBSome-interacting protein 1 [Rhagoletis zephyria]XP_017465689.1 PREDICTED: BBSome-interacting protein 1 [Rhagoletis zephyria]XP_036343679.1 BBSome-interacting protein 1 [Rhagoletis pomonella]